MTTEFYAVTDSDWGWESGDEAPLIVEAESPIQAAEKALAVWDKLAESAYGYADAMIAERTKP